MIETFSQDPRLAGLAVFCLLLLVACVAIWRQAARFRQASVERDAGAQSELARLNERTARLAQIEADHAALAARQSELQAETARLAATLGERDNEARRLEQDLGEARAAFTDLRGRTDQEIAELRQTTADLREKLGSSVASIRARTEENEALRADLDKARQQREEAQRLLGEAQIALREQRTRSEEERKAADEKMALIVEAKTQLSDQFKTLANDILEEKSKSFSEVNKTSLGTLIDPLRTQLADFKGKVEEVYINEAKERSALGAQVRELMGLNQQLSKDAHNLTSALRGQAKAQGNWGEMILERILEAGGLSRGIHYEAQESHAREDGRRVQPDVVLKLPGERFLVVDAKVSLTAYDDYVNGEDEARKEAALKRHLDSVRAHIRELSAKNYQDLYGLSSLDFVVMFVPIEPAFLVAITSDAELWQQAWAKNIMLVSPSSLLFVVRIVAQLWHTEQQSRNTQEIARRGALLYDKLTGFAEDLLKVGKGLRTADDSYRAAMNKFSEGAGNVVGQAEKLRRLGLKPSKRLDPALVDASGDDDEAEDVAALPAPDANDVA